MKLNLGFKSRTRQKFFSLNTNRANKNESKEMYQTWYIVLFTGNSACVALYLNVSCWLKPEKSGGKSVHRYLTSCPCKVLLLSESFDWLNLLFASRCPSFSLSVQVTVRELGGKVPFEICWSSINVVVILVAVLVSGIWQFLGSRHVCICFRGLW